MDIPGVVEDVRGNQIVVGDEIAGAFRIGNVAVLRVGSVVGFGERGNKLTVKVQWRDSSRSYDDEVNGAIEADLKRFVKVGANTQENTTPITVSNP